MEPDESVIVMDIKTAEDKVVQLGIEAMKFYCDKSVIRNIAVNHGVFKPWSDENCEEECKAGRTDSELSEIFGFTEDIISKWREGHHIVANKSVPKPVAQVHRQKANIDESKARELYDQGKSDGAIGKNIGVSGVTVMNWRKRNNLPTKYLRPGTVPVSTETTAKPLESVIEPVKSVPAQPETISEQPKSVSKPIVCQCCGKQPDYHNRIGFMVYTIIGNSRQVLCSDCANIVKWANDILKKEG